jgi:hypothetical protein
MRPLLLTLALACTVSAAPPESFWRALHQVESSGRTSGLILGDNGKSRGPLQISRAYHKDSRVPGAYERVDDLLYARRVAQAYLKRYAPQAWVAGDWRVLCRVHNGGLTGHKKASTLPYLRKIEREMKRRNP